MKIIDLLNKIANDEETPKKIKYKGFELKRIKCNNLLQLYVDEKGMFFPEFYSGLTLNDEVEIIEDTPKEDKKIEKIKVWYQYDGTNDKILTKIMLDELKDKINEIIDYLKSKEK